MKEKTVSLSPRQPGGGVGVRANEDAVVVMGPVYVVGAAVAVRHCCESGVVVGGWWEVSV